MTRSNSDPTNGAAAQYHRARTMIAQAHQKGHSELYLNGMQLRHLPPELWNLNYLRRLYVQNNNLQELSPDIGKLENLEELNISYNQIKSLPSTFNRLKFLARLSLSYNELEELPAEIGELSALQELYAIRNNLQSLPQSIGQLTSLRKLNLWGNQLDELPEQISGLQNLIDLNLIRNNLRKLPVQIRDLKALQELYLHGNAALRLPAEVLGPTSANTHHHHHEPAAPKDILAFYFSGQSRPVLEARLIIIGDGGVGKTSLVRQLIHCEAAREGEQTTPGVTIDPWVVRLRDTDVQINVWDFGGQEPMHAAHPYFFTERTLYLIVASARETGTEDRIEHWLKMIAKYNSAPAAFVVVNKTDQYAMDIARRDLCLKYRFMPTDPEKAFFPTSCTSGYGIDDLRGAILSHLNNMEQIWDLVPTEYFDVKTKIAAMREKSEDVLSFEEWRRICQNAKIIDGENRDRLLNLLRNLGLVVSFPHDQKLSHLGVLNPEWVLKAIYPLLTSPKIAAAGGLITLRDVAELLPQDRYPRERHQWLIELMEAFELLFSDENSRLLIPSLLPKDVPDWVLKSPWDQNNLLRVELRYEAIPESVISRMIVRKHRSSWQNSSWWRHGIAFKDHDCEALARLHLSEGKIELSVLGPKMKRHAFLHALRAELRFLAEGTGEGTLWIALPDGHFENYDELTLFAQNGVGIIPRIVDGRIIQLDVAFTLDQIEAPKQRSGPWMEVHMTEQKADRGGVNIGHGARVRDVSVVWKQMESDGCSPSKLAMELSQLRDALRADKNISADQRDVALGKVIEAKSAAEGGNGKKAIENLKGIGNWVLKVATEIGTTVAAKAIESAIGLEEK